MTLLLVVALTIVAIVSLLGGVALLLIPALRKALEDLDGGR